MVVLENIDIDIDIDKKYLRNIDIDIDIDKEILKISIFKEDLNNTSFYIYGYCGELYRMTFHEIYPKNHPFLCSGASRPQSELFFYCKQANLQKLKINFKSFTLLQHLALFDISI